MVFNSPHGSYNFPGKKGKLHHISKRRSHKRPRKRPNTLRSYSKFLSGPPKLPFSQLIATSVHTATEATEVNKT